MKKIYAGSGYLYLTESVAAGDTPRVFATEADAVAYYNARGNPPGIWLGSGLDGLDLKMGDKVAEEQMRFLFGEGMRPDAQRVMDSYVAANTHRVRKPGDAERIVEEAVRAARLGRAFPKYQQGTLDYTERFNRQVDKILIEQGREPTPAELREARKVAAQKSKQAVAGYDLVFAPVKSASMLWALHDSQAVRAQVKWAHDAAVAEALKYLEEHAAFTRVGAGGPAQVDTRGLVAVSFDHFDNRNGEPHLHTHLAVANRVQAAGDGKWRTIDGRPLHFITVTAGAVYDSAFRAELRKRLGVEWRMRTDTKASKEPVWEVAGVKDEWIKSFASRREGIIERYNELATDYRTAHGRTPDKATERQLARTANLDTRNVKGTAKSLGELNAVWRDQFTDRFGADALEGFQKVVGKPRSTSTPVSGLDLPALAEEVTARVSEYRATWNRWNIDAATHRTLAERGIILTDHAQRTALVGQITNTALGESISLEAPAVVPEPAVLRRKDGVSVFTPHGATRYTSEQILNAENDLVQAATIPGVIDAVPTDRAKAALNDFEQRENRNLDAGQRKLVESFATDTRQTVAGIGPAGTGKTTAMRALAHVVEADGRRLVPLASSGAAAAVLAAELGLPAENVHKFVHEHIKGKRAPDLYQDAPVPAAFEQFRIRPGDVVLVDEAGMTGTLNLDRLRQITDHHGAALRLLGDHYQFSAVESGGALRLIAAETPTVVLDEVHRFHDPAEAEASLSLREGDNASIDFYAANGRLHAGDTDNLRERVYQAWLSDTRDGKVSLMIAGTNNEVTALSARAREDLVRSGNVASDGVSLYDGNRAGTGDLIVTRTPRRDLACQGGQFVKNGGTWLVESRYGDDALAVRNTDHGGRLVLPAAYVAESVELAYAVTGHRSQGRTVDTTHTLIDPDLCGREGVYVPATRGRDANHLYFTVEVPEDQPLTPEREQSEAQAAFVRVLDRDDAEHSATETLRDNLARAGTIADLAEKLAYTEELRTARRHDNAPADDGVLNLAPWIAAAPTGDDPKPDSLAGYCSALADAIADRARELAQAAVTERPHWMAYLGEEPTDPTAKEMWHERVAIICAATDHTSHDQNNPWEWTPKTPDERRNLDIASAAAHQAHDLTTGARTPDQIPYPETEVHQQQQTRQSQQQDGYDHYGTASIYAPMQPGIQDPTGPRPA
ncbi:MobF family relaxase [Glycomyces buryatensis]|uniref:TraA-like conjugal transfer protein n=1 Tax=Glycomyces buryatensis TaxID=2570927 RepID=A0A4V4HSK3_9ACTN|nr:MobF family relaxase [Glycomyces buryatensis]THV42026.1 TraA-like conjugal transfer protein [Glycomyces buryatensis]